MSKKYLIVLPTYNERDNIESLILEISNTLKNIPFQILVIDDNSPDKTFEIVKKIEKKYPVQLIKREKKLGLGSAYIIGFDYGIKHNYDFIITMDADYSHDPKYLPDFIKEENYDLVIGSRYIRGGNTKNWPISRKLLSKIANILVKILLTKKINDNTSGFRMYKVNFLKNINYRLKDDGYSYLFKLLYFFTKRNARIKEIPFIFIERRAGKSKISRKEILKALKTLFILTFRR